MDLDEVWYSDGLQPNPEEQKRDFDFFPDVN